VIKLQYFQLNAKNGIAEVLINRAKQRNAFNTEMWINFSEIMSSISADSTAKVVIITGTGNTFASGADINQLKELTDKEKHLRYLDYVDRAIESIIRCPQPVIAKINGWAVGAGCELAIACDLRICNKEAKFGIPAAKLGISLNHSLVQKVIDLVGVGAAKELLLIGEPVSAQRAYAMGLVNQVVPAPDLEKASQDMARKIAGNAPLALIGIKKAINRLSEHHELADYTDLEQLERNTFESEDFIEGVNAYMERRKPVWKGK